MFDAMLPDMPEDNQVSKSAEQVADAVKLTIDRVIYLLNEWGYPEARRRFIELRSSQTASAASPVAGVSAKGDGCETGPVTELLNSMKVIDRSHRYMECRADLLTQYMYELVRLRAQPSAEGDGWIAVTERLPEVAKADNCCIPEDEAPIISEPVIVWNEDDCEQVVAELEIVDGSAAGAVWRSLETGKEIHGVTHYKLSTPPSVQEEKGSSV